jgi:hypothetical protein
LAGIDSISGVEIGRQEIKEFVRNPHSNSISDQVCNAIRQHQEFLPEAATTSRLLALDCLTTNRGNRTCVYHHNTKSGKVYDGAEGSKFKVTGVTLARTFKVKGKKGTLRQPGYFNCGCSEEVALLDFFFWKSWKVKNERGDEEGLGSQRVDPRLRLFFAECFMKVTMLMVDDLYANGKAPADREKRCIEWQIRRLKTKLKSLQGVCLRR